MERAGKLISKLKLPPGSVTPQDLALAGWAEAVGKRIANHARALSLVTNRLVVEVEDAIWQRQLAGLKSQILKRLEDVLGQRMVREVEFRLPTRRREPQRAAQPRPSNDEADRIEDPVLRSIYKQRRGRKSA